MGTKGAIFMTQNGFFSFIIFIGVSWILRLINGLSDVDVTAVDQMSDKKRGKKKLKSKKAEAEEHEEQLKRLQETVSQSCNMSVL